MITGRSLRLIMKTIQARLYLDKRGRRLTLSSVNYVDIFSTLGSLLDVFTHTKGVHVSFDALHHLCLQCKYAFTPLYSLIV